MNMYYSNEKNVLLMIALLKAHNIKKIITSPGTTNVTFIGSIMHDLFFQLFSCVDERSAAYMACGMAEESGEPVVISCTGATASRNYFPGLTEAYYRKLPVLAITSTREECKIGHLIDQQIDRTRQPKDTVLCSEHLQIIKDEEDWWDCTIKANRALLALKANGGGPAHINLPTLYSPTFDVKILPKVQKIARFYVWDELPEIGKRDVAIFIGTHKQIAERDTILIEHFCEVYNAVVYCDICCGYHGKYSVSMFGASGNTNVDLLIHMGEVSCSAYGCRPKEVWRVSEDGELRDTFRKLSTIFAMPDHSFFSHYVKGKTSKETSKYAKIDLASKGIYKNLNDVPFSNGWIALYLHNKIPLNSVVHLGIVSSYFAWNKFQLDPSININCNQGGFGIDGNLSTLIGASLVNPNKIYYCFLGDLAFFYDLNSLGNRHIKSNVRIMLVNNGKGVIFRKPGNFASMFQQDADTYIAAGGHFGNQSRTLVRNFAENLGFMYFSASTKEEFEKNIPVFISQEITEHPIIFEVFVSTEAEILGDNIKNNERKRPQGIKGVIHDIAGEEFYSKIKQMVNGGGDGYMHVDIGHN